ncbi:hypothetical protein [Puniceicoccus vermicola]|uniref:Uncharacterized protein n=1 Tax=Puniceicoccus vermicola TaxID=388746 RepID=A0A7X1B2D6_9BACT|nr:hypothetical protein [Puniceicoccus vermicola]MBC2603150.1 hypothetical protein [Puniceicoccus vermicola]
MKDDLHLLQLVAEQPTPPRKLKISEVYQRELKKKGSLISGGVGLLGIFGISIFIISRSFNLELSEWLLLLVFAFISLIALSVTSIGPIIRHNILKNGIVTIGTVTEVNQFDGSDATLGALRSGGISVAKICVKTATGTFIAEWDFDGPDWRKIEEGTQLKLLISPNRDIVTDIVEIKPKTQPDDLDNPIELARES